MINQVIAPALTLEEKQFLFEQRNSEHFRVFAKAITWAYSLEASRLVAAKAEDLTRIQGVLQGLLGARGIVQSQSFSGAPDEATLRRIMFPNDQQVASLKT